MTLERSVIFSLPETPQLRSLALDIEATAERATKADPGDRSDIMRFEALCSQLERTVAADPDRVLVEDDAGLPGFFTVPFDHPHEEGAPCKGDSGLVASLAPTLSARVAEHTATGRLTVMLRLPLAAGPGPRRLVEGVACAPAETWRADEGVTGRRAVEQRFREQLDAVVLPTSSDGGAAMCPSGIHNRVLADILREFVDGTVDTRVDARVVYRDGSEASAPFPLRCLPLSGRAMFEPTLTLDLALLSIRHTEMDPVIDGAWLRNAEVSRPRPAGLTDDYVFKTTLAQLNELTVGGTRRVLLRIYQTGLDTAVVGFYRGVVNHLLLHPHSLAVVPQFYVDTRSENRDGSVVQPEAKFLAGEMWAVDKR